MNRAAILAALAAEPWAILPSAVRDIAARVQGLDPAAIEALGDLWADAAPDRVEAYYAARGQAGARSGTVAVLPVLGAISKRDSAWSMMLGGTSTTRLTAQLRALAADESVATILLNVDSPGGTVSGLPELAEEVRKAAQTKHVVAIANDLAASAAYWVAAQADEVVATPEALVGSVGVFTMHQDLSGMLDQMGVKMTFVHAGRYKVEGNPFEPLSDEAREHVQGIVDAAYGMFVADVAKGRSREGASVTPAMVREGYGEGRVLTARDAKAAGMVDRIGTFSETVARLSGVKPTAGARAGGGGGTIRRMTDDEVAEAAAAEGVATPDAADIAGTDVGFAEAALNRLLVDQDAWAFRS